MSESTQTDCGAPEWAEASCPWFLARFTDGQCEYRQLPIFGCVCYDQTTTLAVVSYYMLNFALVMLVVVFMFERMRIIDMKFDENWDEYRRHFDRGGERYHFNQQVTRFLQNLLKQVTVEDSNFNCEADEAHEWGEDDLDAALAFHEAGHVVTSRFHRDTRHLTGLGARWKKTARRCAAGRRYQPWQGMSPHCFLLRKEHVTIKDEKMLRRYIDVHVAGILAEYVFYPKSGMILFRSRKDMICIAAYVHKMIEIYQFKRQQHKATISYCMGRSVRYVLSLLREHENQVKLIAEALLKRGSLNKYELNDILEPPKVGNAIMRRFKRGIFSMKIFGRAEKPTANGNP